MGPYYQPAHLIGMTMLLFSLLSAVVTGWETENKYRVRNTLGQQVYFAAEGEYIHTYILGVLYTKST